MALRPSLLTLAVLLCWSPLGQAATPAPEPVGKSVLPLEDLRVFTKAYEHIRNSYIKDIDDKTLLEYAIRGMLDQLDPHSSYLDASSFDDLQVHTTGEFGGLGIEVGMENGFVKVIAPIDDTPAARAGIEAGDLIVKIDDTTLKGLSLNDAVSRMRGPKGSKIVLTIVREGTDQPFDVTLVRDTIKVRSVRTEVMEDRFLYVRVAQFQVNTGKDVRDALTKATKEKSLQGVILDLRNNPGGVLQASVEVADIFLDGGVVVYTEGRMPQSNFNYNAEPGDSTNGLPLVVLINEGSASASEIVAGALQDHRRALVMGTRSFGKGSVQTVIPITDEKAVKLTTALYFTPNGRSIQAQGIEPDLVIERAELTAIKGRGRITEAQLAGHLDNAKGGKEIKSKDRDEERNELLDDLQGKDNQLYEALNMLKGLTFFKQTPTAVKAAAATAVAE
jgi:carboxyl-terminal processing protease